MGSTVLNWAKFAGVLLVVVALWLGMAAASFRGRPRVERWLGSPATAESGQFGDTFGAANSLFSALGVAGVAFALLMQVRERRDSARAEAKNAELAVLTALVHARAASLASVASELLMYQMEFERLTDQNLVPITNIHDLMRSAFRRRDEREAEVAAIIGYAEGLIGWDAKKGSYLKPLASVE